ncbi:hypothetical protein F5B22DRAFT_142252 [Xylaria bambusicola]|uniref:uncharacterized protein n=1 Tax=Xylaria bambusicola TaxID=326684 RepID=UPI002008CBF8|nr:uncharacterized protein F5B22DRAFT_142252 [Xylaria bambusicola]KAI0517006.1 hypothetical protein F5B22DRAFT_142252 [Xylaria bambusicola]
MSYTDPVSAIVADAIAQELGLPHEELNLDVGFVRNGGNSLSAINITSLCRSRGIPVTVGMILRHATLNHLLEELQESTHHSRELLQSRDSPSPSSPTFGLFRADGYLDDEERKDPAHVTPLQLSFIHASKTHVGQSVIRYLETYRTEHIPVVKHAWETVASTEPIFQTKFKLAGSTYRIVEDAEAPFLWSETKAESREAYDTALLQQTPDTDFIGVAFNVVHLEMSGQERQSTVIWAVHHALIDGFSSVILLNKHRGALSGRSCQPGPSFSSFMRKVEVYRESQAKEGLEFWGRQQELIAQSRENLLFAETGPNPGASTYVSHTFELGTDFENLKQCVREREVTIASMIYAAWALTISQFVGSSSVCFGVVLSGRTVPVPEVETVVGPLINLMPFQTSLDWTMSIRDYIKSVFKHSLDLDQYQWNAPAQLLTSLPFSLLNIHIEEELLNKNPLGLVLEPCSTMESNLNLAVEVRSGGKIKLMFKEDIIHSANVKRLGKTFLEAIKLLMSSEKTLEEGRQLLMAPDIHIALSNSNVYSALTRAESWNNNLVELFDQSVRMGRDRIAIERGSEKLSYSSVLEMANHTAGQLRHHILPGDVVCVHADRSVNWIIAIYATLKAKGVYCPLDQSLPPRVRNQIFEQSGSRHFLAGGARELKYKPESCANSFSVEELLLRVTKRRRGTDSVKPPVIDPNSGAYLCFTSGSTGQPKGVLCTHKALVAFQSELDVRMKSKPGWRIAQIMSPAFDGSIHEIFSALGYGSTLVLGCSEDPFSHLKSVDTAIMTPSIARVLDPNDFPNLSALYLVGEAVLPLVRDRWAKAVELYNMYGPTEGTCGATTKKLQYGEPITLGRPNPSMRIYILSAEGQLVPPGVIGDIYLAGVQVSLGYQNMPYQTYKVFSEDTVYRRDGERMYRTGDRGYWCETGELQFCGRTDRQIKLHGYRVDLDDLEERIRNSVHDCTGVMVVCVKNQISAYVQPESLAIKSVETLLAQALPHYAFPRRIVAVAEFPQTRAGKLDYQALKQFNAACQEKPPFQGNAKLLKQVGDVWKEILHTQGPITADSKFMELGGNSLLQLQMADELSVVLGRKVPLLSIVSSPTLGSLVETLNDVASEIGILVTSTPATDRAVVTQLEQHWCRNYAFRGGSSSFTVSAAFRLGPGTDPTRLVKAWNVVLGRHDIFRCRFKIDSAGWVKKSFSDRSPKVQELKQLDVRYQIHRPFDLEQQSCIRVLISPDTLLLVASHIIMDYKSLETTLQEASCAYRNIPMPSPVYYSSLERKYPEGHREFWQQYMKGFQQPKYRIGTWTPRKSWDGTSYIYRLPTSMGRSLTRYASSKGLTPHHILLGAVALALSRNSDVLDIVLGAPYLGRLGRYEQKAVGLFLELLPIRIKFPNPGSGQKDLLSVVRSCSQSALSHALPWSMILDALGLTPSVPDAPLLDAVVSYQDSIGDMGMQGVDAQPLLTWTEGAKFKFMAEFIKANDGCLLMRLEWAKECFDDQSIGILANFIKVLLEAILEDKSFQEIASRFLQDRGEQTYEALPKDREDLFETNLQAM